MTFEAFEWQCPDYLEERYGVLYPAGEMTPYRPREDLFLEFAGLKTTLKAISGFAQYHGLLGGVPAIAERRPMYSPSLARGLGARVRFSTVQGESVAAWKTEIKDLRQAITYRDNAPGRLWQAINAKLGDNVAPQFVSSHPHDVQLELRPRNLLGFMWLRFALKSRGAWLFRSCRVCKKPMAVRQMGKRHSRLTCTDSCRVTLSRYRRLYETREMSASEIAHRLGVTVSTARKWIGRPRRLPE